MDNQVKRILIAEDSAEWQRFHSSLLKNYDKCKLEFNVCSSATDALTLLQASLNNQYDLIITDLQMETDFAPFYAGEWLIRQIQSLKEYINTRIIIISATYNIRLIAEKYGVLCIPKADCRLPESYKILLGN